MRVVVAPDKFRGSLSAAGAADALAVGVKRWGAEPVRVPLSDGGEGFLEVMGGPNRTTTVTGPLGDPVEACWHLTRRTAVLEMSTAAGLTLTGGAEHNDPLGADTTGVGELLAAALDTGATHIIVGMGGSATTDGGLGALRALGPVPRLAGVRLDVACDVRTRFADAATLFGPQKGASPAQVELLSRRLTRLEELYVEQYEVDVGVLPGAGAAGGLAGALAALGGNLREGFEVVAERVDLDEAIEEADAVLTGEGLMDAASFEGKVVGGVAELATELGTPVGAVVGEVDPGLHDVPVGLEVASLVMDAGREAAFADPAAVVAASAELLLTRLLG